MMSGKVKPGRSRFIFQMSSKEATTVTLQTQLCSGLTVVPITRDQIHGEFERLESIVRKTVVLVTHDMFEAFRLGDRVALMNGGSIVQLGTEEEFRERPATPFVEDFLRNHLRGAG